jgi:sugar phosphate isomerase/epimerase
MRWPADRLGLNVPSGWWAAPSLLKSFEAAGFARAQVHAPPASVLSDARDLMPHATALAAALATSSLEAVVHAPAELRLGVRGGERAGEGLLSYAAQIGATHVVYHACDLPDAPESEDALLFEARWLAALSRRAEQLGVTIAIENLAPVFPGPERLSATPMVLRSLVNRIGSERLGICLDLGHAHIVAERRRTSIEALIEPVLDAVTLFHLHDNLGARWEHGDAANGVDPLRLDLHLAPGRGTLPWGRLAPTLAAHRAPLMLEVHPPHRPRPEDLFDSVKELLSPGAGKRARPAPVAG